MSTRTAEERFWSRVRKSDGCWEWMGAAVKRGHGQVHFGGRLRLAHRVAWELANGLIPEGMVICHHCDNPPCVRVDHLFMGTQGDNVRDMDAKGRRAPMSPVVGPAAWDKQRSKTHCPAGHPYDAANTLTTTQGWRHCRTCRRLNRRARYQVGKETGRRL